MKPMSLFYQLNGTTIDDLVNHSYPHLVTLNDLSWFDVMVEELNLSGREKDLLQKDALVKVRDTLKEYVDESSFIGYSHKDKNIYDIPIFYYVEPDEELNKEKLIHKISYEDLKNWNEDSMPKEKIEYDILGVYYSDPCSVHIYVRRIMESANRCKCSFETLLLQVLYHEFAHAIMDTRQINSYPNLKNGNGKLFEEIREESLANGMSLYFLRNTAELKFSEYARIFTEFVPSQPLQYALGLSYIDERVLYKSVKTWTELKGNGKIYVNASIVSEWYEELSKGPMVPWHLLEPKENQFILEDNNARKQN